MAMLTAADVAGLVHVAITAQEPTSLVLYRPDGVGSWTTMPAQDVQVVYAKRQNRTAALAGTEQQLADVTFWREPPFDVIAGDAFTLDGHRGGVITRNTGTDPILGLVFADATLDVGTA